MNIKGKGQLGVTKKGALLVLGLTLILIYFCRQPQWIWPFIAVNTLAFLLIVIDFRQIPAPSSLVIERQIESTWQLRRQKVGLVITNHALNPISGLLRDTPPPGFGTAPLFTFNLAPVQTCNLVYEITPNRRGAHEFGQVYVELNSPWGLVKKRFVGNWPERVEIIPDLEPLARIRWLSRNRLLQNDLAKHRHLGEGTDFANVRQYVQGDEYRRVNWRVTAKLNQLHTNIYDMEKNQTIWLVLDAGRRMMIHTEGQPAFEHGISAVLALAQAALDWGDQVGLLIVADQVLTAIPPQKGPAGMRVLLQGLAGAAAVRRETDLTSVSRYLGAHLRRRSLICIFSSLGEPQNAKWIAKALTEVRKKHLILFLSLEPQGARRWSEKQVSGIEEAFNKGAAQVRRLQSKNAAFALAHAGLEVVSVPAGELALAGVQAYFRLKMRI